jgi:TetR/AcrR family transcriptional repressor of lmrAB and yxaGH operons
MAIRGETRRRLVSATLRLLRRRGVHGTGLQEILDESGAPRGSLYFHFPGGKDQLVEEAVALAGQRGERWMRRCLDASPTVARAFASMLEEYAALLQASAYSEGCAVAAVALDLGSGADGLQAACGLALEGWVALLAAGLRGEGLPAEEAGARALAAMAAFEGALLVCRARRDVSALRAVAGQSGALLSSARQAR